ncbi:MAG: hypothetical protein AB7G06_09110 [Bdellovibrionales bacterium]
MPSAGAACDAVIMPCSEYAATQARRLRAVGAFYWLWMQDHPGQKAPPLLLTGKPEEISSAREYWASLNTLRFIKADRHPDIMDDGGAATKTHEHGAGLRPLIDALPISSGRKRRIHVITNAAHMLRVLSSLSVLSDVVDLVPWRVSHRQHEKPEAHAMAVYEAVAVPTNIVRGDMRLLRYFFRALRTPDGAVF